ncbi:MAG: hypothetical protein JO230_30330 [Xanthobacteraceae bacterium]|nr:hypothetical protein [Xanthobacteraceae bacterium]
MGLTYRLATVAFRAGSYAVEQRDELGETWPVNVKTPASYEDDLAALAISKCWSRL